MADCVRTPTATISVPSVAQTVFTTTRTVESSLPTQFVTSTDTAVICSFVSSLTRSLCETSFDTTVATIPGRTTTVVITEITTLPITTFVPSTLFGTSCPPDVTPSVSDDPQTPTPTPTPIPTSTSTPDPDPDPDPIPTPTSTPTPGPPPSSFSSPTSTPSSMSGLTSGRPSYTSSRSTLPSSTSVAQESEGGTSIAPIVGGAVGGAVGLLALGVLIWFFFKKPAFGNSSKIDSRADDLEDIRRIPPEKHVMGFQGAQPIVQNQGQNPNQPPSQNGIKGTPHQMPQHNMSPPPPLNNGGVPLVAPFVNQAYPPWQPQYSNPSNDGYHPHQAQVMQQGYYAAPSTLSHSPSVMPSTQYGSQYSLPLLPVGGPPPQTHGHAPSASVSSYSQSSGPVSAQNAQVLQVMNPETPYHYNHTQGGSISSAGYPTASSTVPIYPTDGKGRPVNSTGEKAPIVHLDGGRFEELGASTSGITHSPSDPPPPAYT